LSSSDSSGAERAVTVEDVIRRLIVPDETTEEDTVRQDVDDEPVPDDGWNLAWVGAADEIQGCSRRNADRPIPSRHLQFRVDAACASSRDRGRDHRGGHYGVARAVATRREAHLPIASRFANVCGRPAAMIFL
jgi:hypothetical protein